MPTADQDRVIGILGKLNAQASNISPEGDPQTLEAIDDSMAIIRVLLTASGLAQDPATGEWK